MSPTRRQPADPPPRDVRAVLLEVEHLLREDLRRRAERAGHGGAGRPDRAEWIRRATELDEAAAGAPAEAARYAGRLREARARLALHARDIPAGALAGLYEDVRAATGGTPPWARSRMTDAFLDAPRQLVRWRSTALAACALLALGAGLFAGGRLVLDDGGATSTLERQDPRDRLLLRSDATVVQPASLRDRASPLLGNDTPRSVRSGSGSSFFVFYGDTRQPSAARQRLDAVPVKVFPVGVRADDVEQN